MKTQVAILVLVFVLVQFRMELLALVVGGPAYDPQTHGEVVLLGTETCGYCRQARRYLDEHDVPFVEHDVAKDPEGAALLRASGRFAVPVLLVGDEVVQGFDPLAIRAAFARVAAGADDAAGRRGGAGALQKP